MIQITPHMRIFVAVEPVDFRQGIDGLLLRRLDTLGKKLDQHSGCMDAESKDTWHRPETYR